MAEQAMIEEMVSALDKCRAIIKYHVQPGKCVALGDDVISALQAHADAVTALIRARATLTKGDTDHDDR